VEKSSKLASVGGGGVAGPEAAGIGATKASFAVSKKTVNVKIVKT